MVKEILNIAHKICKKECLPSDKVFRILETALIAVMKKQNGKKINIRVDIDKINGEFTIFRKWQVVKNVNCPKSEITLDAAKFYNSLSVLGDYVEDTMDSICFDRSAIHTIKKILFREIREAKYVKEQQVFLSKKGKIIIGTVKKSTRQETIISISSNIEAKMLQKDKIPHENFQVGDKIRGLLYQKSSGINHNIFFITRSQKNMLIELFKIEIPEIRNNIIKIKAVARDPGSRSKVAVIANDRIIDPIGACIGIKGSRIQAISNQLSGEKIDIIAWNPDPISLVINSLAPARVESMFVNEISHTVEVAVKTKDFAQAIGHNGQNIRLAQKISGWNIVVITLEDMQERCLQEAKKSIKIFCKYLEIGESVASILTKNGIFSFEQLTCYAKHQSCLPGLDFETLAKITHKAQNYC